MALENTIRGLLRTGGVAFPTRGTRFAGHGLESIGEVPPLLAIIRPLPEARATVVRRLAVLDRRTIGTAKRDEVCRLLVTVPGVGPHTAVAFEACIDDPARSSRSRTVGAWSRRPPEVTSARRTDS